MTVFKVVARSIKAKRQVKKKVYESNDKYKKYAEKLIFRWSELWDLEIYQMKNEEYSLWYEIKAPRTEEDLRKMQKDRNYTDNWFNYRLKNL